MENASTFDLNAAIGRWRKKLAESPAFRAENLDELEAHLRDSARLLQTKGLSGEEAFLVAVRRLGGPDDLGHEFGKFYRGSVGRSRARWMLAGVLACFITASLADVFSALSVLAGNSFIANPFALGYLGLAGKCAALGVAVYLSYLCANGGRGATTRELFRRPWAVVVVLLAVTLGLKAAAAFSSLALINWFPPSSLSAIYMVTMAGGQLGALIFIIVLAVILALISSTRPRPSNIGSVAAVMLAAAPLFVIGCGKTQPPSAGQPSATAAPADRTGLEQSLALWQGGDQKAGAVEGFLKVDWTGRPLFHNGSVMNYTEAQFAALPQAAREKLGTEMMGNIESLKQVWAAADKSGADALAKGDTAAAEKCFTQLKACADALSRPDALQLVQIVGKGLQKKADARLAALKK